MGVCECKRSWRAFSAARYSSTRSCCARSTATRATAPSAARGNGRAGAGRPSGASAAATRLALAQLCKNGSLAGLPQMSCSPALVASPTAESSRWRAATSEMRHAGQRPCRLVSSCGRLCCVHLLAASVVATCSHWAPAAASASATTSRVPCEVVGAW